MSLNKIIQLIVSLVLIIPSCLAQQSWNATSTFNPPTGREDHTAIWTGSKMIVWGGIGDSGLFNTGGMFEPVQNYWQPTSTLNAPAPRYCHTAVWTGSRMIVWGGGTVYQNYNDGGMYDPISDSWTSLITYNAPSPRADQTAVWTGNRMIVWGGDDSTGVYFNTGGIYDPFVALAWVPTSTVNAPSPRSQHSAVWTGKVMIIWGGTDQTTQPLRSGGIYDPVLDRWMPISTLNSPRGTMMHSAVWTGSKMIVWGGDSEYVSFNTGGIYDPSNDTWTCTSTIDAPDPREDYGAVWTGNKMLVWGGIEYAQYSGPTYLNTGGIYDPINDCWSDITLLNAPSPRENPTAVWTGNEMIVWGGNDDTSDWNTGGIYFNPTIIGIRNINETIPTSYSLHQNYPNPFNPSTVIRFDMPKSGNVVIKVFDITGHEVATVVNEFKNAGEFEIKFDGSNLASGIYFYRLQSGSFVDTKKMMLIK